MLRVRLYPDPILKTPSSPVDHITDQIQRHLDDMIETMRELPGCVGLAGPQVGIPLRLAVLDVSQHPKTTKHHGLTILINPSLEKTSGEYFLREGCASVPDYTGNVRRFHCVKVSALSREGRPFVLETEGFEAVALQHELDHLQGLLFLDRLRPHDLFPRKNYGKR